MPDLDPYNWFAALTWPPDEEEERCPGVPFNYKCPTCEVSGHGFSCWSCGDEAELFIGWTPSLGQASVYQAARQTEAMA